MKKGILLGGGLFLSAIAPSYSSKHITVGPEDTVYGIAYQEGILTRSIISANNLKPPYVLSPGQVLIIPAANEHIAAHGETLKTIAETYGVNVDVLAQENSLLPSYIVKQGDTFTIPPRDTQSMAEVFSAPPVEIETTSLEPLPLVKSAPGAPSPQDPGGLPSDIAAELAREKEVPLKKEALPPAVEAKKDEEKKKIEKKEEEKEKKKEKETAKEQKEVIEEKPAEVAFMWPVDGAIIKKFTAGTNDGINIEVVEGTPVKAAAGGEVIYVGNEIKNLGTLILIKHDQGYVTAYSHLSEALVKKGDTLKKGATIGHSGASGEVSEPQLHFEIRKGKKPIDPMEKLQ